VGHYQSSKSAKANRGRPSCRLSQRSWGGHLGHQTSLKPCQVVRPLPTDTEGVVELVVDRLHDLTYTGQPASQPLRPGVTAVLSRWTDDLRSISQVPPVMVDLALESLIHHIRAQGWLADAWHSRVGVSSPCEEGFGQWLVLGTRWRKPEARDHIQRIDGSEQMETLAPAQSVAPANVSEPSQPADTPSLDIPNRHRRAIQGFVGTVLCAQQVYQVQTEGGDRIPVASQEPIVLRAVRQGGKGST
jgi:hypothetical protein